MSIKYVREIPTGQPLRGCEIQVGYKNLAIFDK